MYFTLYPNQQRSQTHKYCFKGNTHWKSLHKCQALFIEVSERQKMKTPLCCCVQYMRFPPSKPETEQLQERQAWKSLWLLLFTSRLGASVPCLTAIGTCSICIHGQGEGGWGNHFSISHRHTKFLGWMRFKQSQKNIEFHSPKRNINNSWIVSKTKQSRVTIKSMFYNTDASRHLLASG